MQNALEQTVAPSGPPPIAGRLAGALFAAVLLIACAGGAGERAHSDQTPADPPAALDHSEEPVARPNHAALAERARLVHGRFRPERALAVVAYADRHFRVRGNEGYVKTLERVRDDLRGAGFGGGGSDHLALVSLGPTQTTWTPRSATLEIVGGTPQRIVHFDNESEVDRAALLVRSSAFGPAEVEVVSAAAVRAGEDASGRVVLAEGEPGPLYNELVAGSGAIGLLTRNLEPYHDTAGHPDMAQFGYLPEHERPVFGFSLSRQDYLAMQGVERVRVHVDVALGHAAAAAVDARIVGADPAAGAIVFVAHVDEPGANDNGSGVGALTELAIALRSLIESGEVPRPRRTMVFLFGQEIEVSRRWLDNPPVPVAAGLVLDMVGEDPQSVGAPFLIERMPDPGAIWLRGDDRHTEWGGGQVSPDQLHGHFLNDLMVACAGEVGALDGPWNFRTNPYEGGSDHVPFLEHQLPAVLGWHFTDDAYHTTVDRMDRVSAEEMRRVSATFGAAALTMASDDLSSLRALLRYARSVRLRELGRASSALVESGQSDAATERLVTEAWRRWYEQAAVSIDRWAAR